MVFNNHTRAAPWQSFETIYITISTFVSLFLYVRVNSRMTDFDAGKHVNPSCLPN